MLKHCLYAYIATFSSSHFVSAPVGLSLSSIIPALCLQILQDIVARHQAARALVTDGVVDAFMAVRPMQDVCLPASKA